MANTINVSTSSTSPSSGTVNPQNISQTSDQNVSTGQLQSPISSGSLNNSPIGGSPIIIKNFDINSLAVSGQPVGSATESSTTKNHLNGADIAIICIFVIAALLALMLVNRSSKNTTK